MTLAKSNAVKQMIFDAVVYSKNILAKRTRPCISPK